MYFSLGVSMASSPRIVYQQGDHVCALYGAPEEQLQAAVEYIRGGLGRGERCLYVCCEHSVKEFRAALKRAGIDADKEEARGALVLMPKWEGHLKGGTFDPDKMISMLHAAVQDALAAGFTGLCAAGDMSWLLDEAPGSERLAEYEARLNHFYESHRALGLCLYNRSKLPPATIDHGIATHPYIRIEGPLLLENPFYEEPKLAAKRRPRPREVARKIRHFRRRKGEAPAESAAA
jgi:MEDS: MEthanogen/methylotroph, DcmR Sensory domain